MERPIKELLILLRDNAKVESTWFGLRKRINSGLCRELNFIAYKDMISPKEQFILFEYMRDNRPKGTIANFYWWEEGLWKPRLKWLNKLIASL